MDEQTLNILLECPVCLNTLNESSRVLPCQHTFCLTCLEDILGKRGSLLCPECRTVVTISIDHLPRNILLMRLLEGLKSRRNSNVHVMKHPIDAGLQRMAKSTPNTPDYAASSSFAFLFPFQSRRNSDRTEDSPTTGSAVIVSRHSSNQHLSPGGPHILHRRTSAVCIVAQPPPIAESGGQESARWRSGLRGSRTTTDLSSLAQAQEEGSNGRRAEDDDRSIPVPTIRFTEPPIDQPVYHNLFSNPNWRQSSRNRSLPANPVVGVPPEAELNSRRPSPSRSVSHPAESEVPPQPLYRTWLSHPPLETDSSTKAAVMEVVFSNKPARFVPSGSQNSFVGHRGQPEIAAQPMVHASKETRSFIKQLFGGSKNHRSSNSDLLAHKFKALSTSEQEAHRSLLHEEDKTKKSHINNFRSAATRHSGKPANFECYRCVTPYPAKNHYELDLHLNDLLYVHQRHSDGWMKATHERTGRNGLIPIAFVERLHSNAPQSS